MKVSKLALLSLLVSSSLVLGTQVQAEEEAAATLKSKSTVSFEKDTSPTNPLDPILPDEENPVTPTDPEDHENGTPGPLSIDYVSNIRFGLNKASGKDEIYWANLDTVKDSQNNEVEVPNFVQITDKRGVWDGWSLTVTQDTQFYNTTADESLDGAVITLFKGIANSKDGGEAPVVSAPVVLTVGTPVAIATAEESKGSGTWSVRYGADAEEAKQSISLAVPAKTTKAQGEYGTTLTWKLTDSSI